MQLGTNIYLGSIELNVNSIYQGSEPALISPFSAFTTNDQDVNNFINATGIATDYIVCSAINDFVSDLKSNNLWNKLYAIYPFVGNVENSCRVNLKNTGSFYSAFTGSGTPFIFNNFGITSNAASSSFMNTYWNPLSVNTHWPTSASLAVYSRTNTSQVYDMGTQITGTTGNQTSLQIRDPGNLFYPGLPTDGARAVSNTTGSGFFQASLSGSFVRGFRNNTMISSGSVTVGGFFGNHTFNLYLGAINENGTAAAFSSRNYAYASIGGALSQTDMENYNTAVQKLQTQLERNV